MAKDDEVRLTPKQERVLRTLARYGQQHPAHVAARAFIRTTSPRETAARHCINLTKKGLAEKHGTRVFPEWRITDAGVRALLSTLSPEAESTSPMTEEK